MRILIDESLPRYLKTVLEDDEVKMVGRKLAIVVFPSNRLVIVKTLEEKLKATIKEIQAGDYIELS
jgi:hypothetical protein